MLKVSPGLELSTEAVTQTFAILARRGAGKTYTASVMAEEMLKANYPIVWLDPLGVAWGLRSKFSIAILGGDHADIPIDPTAGRVIADFIVAERIPVIVDVSEFGENQMRQFVADFADQFYRKNREAIHWFVDEADEFAPQTATGKGPTARCLGAMQNIVRRGRARGIGVTMITQRSAVLSKSILSQTEGLFAMQTTHPKDLKAIEEWIEYHGFSRDEKTELMQTVPKLQQGEAYFYSPGWMQTFKRIKVRKRDSFDSSSTPKAGEQKSAPRSLADVDLSTITAALNETIEQAKASDPKELHKRIRQLEKEKASLEKKVGRLEKDLASERAKPTQVTTLGPHDHATMNALKQIHRIAGKFVEETISVNVQPITPSKPAASPSDKLPKAEGRILQALYWLKNEEATRQKVGFYSGYSTGSGGFNNALGKLRSKGLVDGWQITDAGIEALGDVEPKPTGRELREWLRPKLGKAENTILDVLIGAYPNCLMSDEIANAAGYSAGSGGFNNALGRLRNSVEAIEGYDRNGGAKAAGVFFEQ